MQQQYGKTMVDFPFSTENARLAGAARFACPGATMTIPIIVRPTEGRPGFYSTGIAGAGELFIRPSRQPFLDAARALLAAGADPSQEIELWHDGADYYSLHATVGAAAALMVEETGEFRPRFRKYRQNPHAGRQHD